MPKKSKLGKEEVKRLISQGMHPRDIATEYGVHSTTVAKFCKKNSIRYESKSDSKYTGRYTGKIVGGCTLSESWGKYESKEER